MPYFTVEEFDEQVLNITNELNEFINENNLNKKDINPEEYGVFVFYNHDVDGICSMFILEHHTKFRNGLKLTAYPILNESDIYTYIKKTLAIKTAYPSLKFDKYLRVILLAINGWNEQILYSIKLYFERFLPENLRKFLKIVIITTIRPLSFYNTKHTDEWYFFLQDNNDKLNEIQQEENYKDDNVVINNFYKINSTSSLIESVVECINECDKAIVLFATCIGILSCYEFTNIENSSLSQQIRSNYFKILSLQGGPYVIYDNDKLLTPLITLTTFEESLKISPYVLIYDPHITNDTLSDIRIFCNLKLNEYNSNFTNLSPLKQKNVLSLLKNKLNVKRNTGQLCWKRRILNITSIDILYILLFILNKENKIIIKDFLYNILIERINEDSHYDKNILYKLKNKTYEYIRSIYQLIINCKIKSVNTSYNTILTTTIYPNIILNQSYHLNFISYLIISIYNKNKEKSENNLLLLFINNKNIPKMNNKNNVNASGEYRRNKNSDLDDSLLVFGYNHDLNNNLWPMVFKSLSHQNQSFVQDYFNPNLLSTKLGDIEYIRKIIIENFKIIQQIKYNQEDEISQELESLQEDLEE
ncbi:hypothetical protein TpMuguga_01g02450 [Theileria parva strain Muguga]|uniref:uncharacterized protein n=1 Tax=Theileria parva strain Muguga TaxID=333668 RepID=UPI001C61E34E|nr:uncharacterized protein TpMuguga_01g02450 [Theileria parva strain Muguga]KAF5153416.1 hypothetical protein TpMuguga_01g02450 [Theileria parva strain Muguga]